LYHLTPDYTHSLLSEY